MEIPLNVIRDILRKIDEGQKVLETGKDRRDSFQQVLSFIRAHWGEAQGYPNPQEVLDGRNDVRGLEEQFDNICNFIKKNENRLNDDRILLRMLLRKPTSVWTAHVEEQYVDLFERIKNDYTGSNSNTETQVNN